MYLDHAEVAVEEAPVLRVLAALDVVGHGQEDVAGGSVVEVEHVLPMINTINQDCTERGVLSVARFCYVFSCEL